MNNNRTISDRVDSIPEALSIYINQIVYDLTRQNYDITTLSLGESFFDIPFFGFDKINVEKGYHYSDSQGIPELRLKISKYYSKLYNASVNHNEEILITAGSKVAIYMAMISLANPGDEILIHEPAWLSYPEQAKLAGLNPKFIPFDCPVEEFVNYYSSKTKILVICNPNNPSGRLYTGEELKKIYDTAVSRNIYVLVDEAYSDFVIDSGFRSMTEIVPSKKGIIVVNSLSKNFGMSGWRIGYVIANKNEINALLKVNQHLITCAPTLLLLYLSRYFDDILKVTIPQVKEVVNKRNRVLSMMKTIGLDYLDGGTTFYFFVNIGKFPGSSLELSLHLLLNFNISVSPGSAYGENTDRFIRISIGTESEERIYIALQAINDVLHEGNFDRNKLNSELFSRGFHIFKE